MNEVYAAAGGPSFSIESFYPQAGYEAMDIASLLEYRAVALVDQAWGFPILSPQISPGPGISVKQEIANLFEGYTDVE
jgi:hypothetical protein